MKTKQQQQQQKKIAHKFANDLQFCNGEKDAKIFPFNCNALHVCQPLIIFGLLNVVYDILDGLIKWCTHKTIALALCIRIFMHFELVRK